MRMLWFEVRLAEIHTSSREIPSPVNEARAASGGNCSELPECQW